MTDIELADGRVLKNVHRPDACWGPNCCIHNPSDHPLKDAPKFFMNETNMMYRVCEHGIHHPDPDSADYAGATLQFGVLEATYSVHISHCDGCCHPA